MLDAYPDVPFSVSRVDIAPKLWPSVGCCCSMCDMYGFSVSMSRGSTGISCCWLTRFSETMISSGWLEKLTMLSVAGGGEEKVLSERKEGDGSAESRVGS